MATTGDRTYELVLSLSNGNSVSAGTFTVPQGDKGDTGDKGDKGDTGATGPQGEPGIGCSVNGVPTALDFTSDPQAQIDVLKKLYGVGSIYMSTNSTSPASIFGGTWEQIKDRFLLGAGNSYSAGNSGGEATHTLTVAEMPSHTHHLVGTTVNGLTDAVLFGGTSNGTVINGAIATGGSQPHNNMPPYEAVYIWKRTA